MVVVRGFFYVRMGFRLLGNSPATAPKSEPGLNGLPIDLRLRGSAPGASHPRCGGRTRELFQQAAALGNSPDPTCSPGTCHRRRKSIIICGSCSPSMVEGPTCSVLIDYSEMTCWFQVVDFTGKSRQTKRARLTVDKAVPTRECKEYFNSAKSSIASLARKRYESTIETIAVP